MRTSAFTSSPDKLSYRRNIEGEPRSLILRGSTFAVIAANLGGRWSPADLNPRRLHLRHAVIRWFIWPWPGAGGYIHGRVRPQAVVEGPVWRVWKMSEHGRAGAALHLSGSMCSGSLVGKPVSYIINVTLTTFCRNASLMAPTQCIRSLALSRSISQSCHSSPPLSGAYPQGISYLSIWDGERRGRQPLMCKDGISILQEEPLLSNQTR